MDSWKEHFLWLLRCIQSKEKKNSLSAARLSLPPGHLKCALPLPSFLWYGLRVEGEAPQVTRAGSLDWRASLSERQMCHWSHPTVTYRQARQAGRVWQTTTKSLHENALRHLFLCSYYNPVERKFHSQSGNLRGLLLSFLFQSSLSWWITFDFEMKKVSHVWIENVKNPENVFCQASHSDWWLPPAVPNLPFGYCTHFCQIFPLVWRKYHSVHYIFSPATG